MKRLIIFLFILILFVLLYNTGAIYGSLRGTFGDISYRKNSLLDAEKHYTEVLRNSSGNTLLSADILYNLGNTFYRLGELEQNEKRIHLWEKSIGSYTKSLAIRTDSETEENLAFVKEKLQKEKREQEEEKKEDEKIGSWTEKQPNQTENTTGSGEENKEEAEKPETGSGKTQTQSGQNWSNGGSYNPVGWQNTNNDIPLSDEDRQEVQKYLEHLKQFEKQNGKFLNPEKPGEAGSISDQIRNFFGNDSFFQDILPTNDSKKDW